MIDFGWARLRADGNLIAQSEWHIVQDKRFNASYDMYYLLASAWCMLNSSLDTFLYAKLESICKSICPNMTPDVVGFFEYNQLAPLLDDWQVKFTKTIDEACEMLDTFNDKVDTPELPENWGTLSEEAKFQVLWDRGLKFVFAMGMDSQKVYSSLKKRGLIRGVVELTHDVNGGRLDT